MKFYKDFLLLLAMGYVIDMQAMNFRRIKCTCEVINMTRTVPDIKLNLLIFGWSVLQATVMNMIAGSLLLLDDVLLCLKCGNYIIISTINIERYMGLEQKYYRNSFEC